MSETKRQKDARAVIEIKEDRDKYHRALVEIREMIDGNPDTPLETAILLIVANTLRSKD